MLIELNIKNYALIDSLRIEFDQGLNVLTGETGAGKSIIIDALGLLLGDKASSSTVRKDAQRCEITGVFDIQKNRVLQKLLQSLSLIDEGGQEELLVRREVDAQGKSRAFINDKPVSLSALSEVGDFLIDIHGQHEHQRLLKLNEQRDLLDGYGGHESLREKIADLFREWKKIDGHLTASQLSEQEKNQKIDLYKFQVNEIDSAKLKQGEEEELETLLPQLKNAERLREWANEIYDHLYDCEGSALERLRKGQKLISSIAQFGVDLKDAPALIEESLVRVNEVVNQIESLKNGLVSDPKRLDEIISRQDLTAKLKKKYGSTVQEILEYRDKTKDALDQLESHSEIVAELEKKKLEVYGELKKQCKKLSESREKGGKKLAGSIQKELKDLGFNQARFSIELVTEKDENGREVPGSTGFEKVEFVFSANAGEDLKPLKEVASGGELSRVMLALKKILAESDIVPTLIFDEIDSGIGGSMGNVIGEKLGALSRSHQILVITHLPQIAVFAARHISVKKSVSHQRTQTTIELLAKEERVREVARMLGGGTAGNGQQLTSASLKHAAELLKQAG